MSSVLGFHFCYLFELGLCSVIIPGMDIKPWADQSFIITVSLIFHVICLIAPLPLLPNFSFLENSPKQPYLVLFSLLFLRLSLLYRFSAS